jgi:flagellar hook-basal body complex protein FliE
MISDKTVNGVLGLLQQAQEVHRKSSELAAFSGLESSATTGKFSDSIMDVIKDVNSQQMQASETRALFEYSEDMPLTQVILDTQKASIAFEATLQIRNKVLKAYQDIMSMPV